MTSLIELLSEGPIGNVMCRYLPKEFLCNVAIVSRLACSAITRYLKFRFGQKYDFDTFSRIRRDDYGFWVSMTVAFSIAKGDLVEAMFLMDDGDIDVFKVCIDECLAYGMEISKIKRKSPMCDEESEKDFDKRRDRIIKYHDAQRWRGLDNLVVHLMLSNRCILYDYLQEKYDNVLSGEHDVSRILVELVKLQCDEMLSKFPLELVREPKDGMEQEMQREIFSECEKFSYLPLTLSKIAPSLNNRTKENLIRRFIERYDHDSIDIMVKFGNLNSDEQRLVNVFYGCIEKGNHDLKSRIFDLVEK